MYIWLCVDLTCEGLAAFAKTLYPTCKVDLLAEGNITKEVRKARLPRLGMRPVWSVSVKMQPIE